MPNDVRLRSFALTLFPSSEVLCAYAAPVCQAFADMYDRWIVVGSFTVPQAVRGRLWVVGFRTPGVTAQVRLYDPEVVSGSEVQISSDRDASVLSSPIEFATGKTYQVAVMAHGTSDAANYAVIRTVSLAPPEVA